MNDHSGDDNDMIEEVFYDQHGNPFDSEEEYEFYKNSMCNDRFSCGNCKFCVDY